MKQLINKIFSGIYRIIIHEDSEKYEIEDSIVLKGSVSFQLFTNQENLNIIKLSDSNYHIDGEFDYNHIELLPIIEEVIEINKILVVYDQSINQIIAFSIKGTGKDFYFIRNSDEIFVVQESEYESMVSSNKKARVTEFE